MKLIKYKYKILIPLKDGEFKTIYELTFLKSYLFGLIKKKVILNYDVLMFSSIKEHEKHWQDIIESKRHIC